MKKKVNNQTILQGNNGSLTNEEKILISAHDFPNKENESIYKFLSFFLARKLNLPVKRILLFWSEWKSFDSGKKTSLSKWNNSEYKLHFKEGCNNECLEIYLNNTVLSPSSIGTMELMTEIFLSVSFVIGFLKKHGREEVYNDSLFAMEKGFLFAHDAFVSSNASRYLMDASEELIDLNLCPDDFDTSLLYYMIKNIDDMTRTCFPFMTKGNALKYKRESFYCTLNLSAYIVALEKTFPSYLDGTRNDLESLLEKDVPLLKEVTLFLSFFKKFGFFSGEEWIDKIPYINCLMLYYTKLYHPYIYLRYSEKKQEQPVLNENDKEEEDNSSLDSFSYRPTTWEDVEACKNAENLK